MTGTPVLIQEYKNTGAVPNPQIGVAQDSVTTFLGNAITGASYETGGSVVDQAGIRVRRWYGQSTFIAVQGEKIFRTTDAGVTWSTVLTDTDLGSTVVKSALMVAPINGQMALMILCRSGAGAFTFFWSFDGTTWDKRTVGSGLTDQTMAMQSTIIFQNRMFAVVGTSSVRTLVVSLDDGHDIREVTHVDWTGSQSDGCLCEFNGKLYGIWTNASSVMKLYRWGNQGWMATSANLGGAAASLSTHRKAALFVDPTSGDMIAIFCGGNPLSWYFYRIDTSETATDISSSVKGTPGSTFDGVDTTPSNTARVGTVTDGPAGGSATAAPTVWVYFAANGTNGTQVEVDRWAGPSTPTVDTSVGGNVQAAWPWGVQLGGDAYYSGTMRLLQPVSMSPAQGGVLLKYKLYGIPGVTVDSVTVRGGYAETPGPWADTTMSLASPSPGTLSANTITGLDAGDNGATLHEVVWDSSTDNVVPGTRARQRLEVY